MLCTHFVPIEYKSCTYFGSNETPRGRNPGLAPTRKPADAGFFHEGIFGFTAMRLRPGKRSNVFRKRMSERP